MADAFYLPDGEEYVATEHTRGPWDPRAQHGGPPSALLAHALERAYPRGDAQLVRLSVEILRPVPIAPLAVTIEVLRSGHKVELLGATLTVAGEAAVLARGWRVRTADIGVAGPLGPGPHGPETGREAAFFPGLPDIGWHRAVEVRFLAGTWNETGPANAWCRLRMPLVAGRAPSPFERVLVVADAGNGISAAVDFTAYVFVNLDLAVSLHRLPDGEWVHMAAETRVEPHGVGLATTRLSDERGPLGVGAQSLFVDAR